MSGIGKAFTLYCDVMGHEEPDADNFKGWWTSIFEFTAFMGMGLVDLKKDSIHTTEEIDSIKEKYLDHIKYMLDILEGPHGATIIRAYRAKRYSVWGRVKTPIIKLSHLMVVLLLAFRIVVPEWFVARVEWLARRI